MKTRQCLAPIASTLTDTSGTSPIAATIETFFSSFQKDRHCFESWLSEARQRYGLSLLNYIVTCNHLHLLVYDLGEPPVMEKSMQLIAGQVAAQYNRREGRSGAFWEGRYHATAVQNGKHLRQCMRYINLNMVRTGGVNHPSQWKHSACHRIQNPLQKIVSTSTRPCGA